MALDKTALAEQLKEIFTDAKDNSWPSDQVADALADAIDQYVRGAKVTGVQVEVKDLSNTVIGSGTQNNLGELQ
jgi:hypothetical protein